MNGDKRATRPNQIHLSVLKSLSCLLNNRSSFCSIFCFSLFFLVFSFYEQSEIRSELLVLLESQAFSEKFSPTVLQDKFRKRAHSQIAEQIWDLVYLKTPCLFRFPLKKRSLEHRYSPKVTGIENSNKQIKKKFFIITGKNNLRHRFSRYLLVARKSGADENVADY